MTNRDILFRAKRVDNGEWVYGDFTHDKENRAIIRRIVAQPLFMDENGNFSDTIYACSDYKVYPDTVSQFTGLCDRSCNRIYEGDIVKFCGIVGEVVFEKGAFGIGTQKTIDYDFLEKEVSRKTGNLPEFCGNDNFISLWELYWNFNSEDNQLDMVTIIRSKYDSHNYWRNYENNQPLHF